MNTEPNSHLRNHQPKQTESIQTPPIQSTHPRKTFDSAWFAIILISFGLIFLLNNFGILPWEFWNVIWRFWPLLLVLLGLQAVIGKSRWANLAVTITGLCFVIIILIVSATSVNLQFNQWMQNQIPWWPSTNLAFKGFGQEKTQKITTAHDEFKGVKKREISVKIGSAAFSLEDDTSQNFFDVDAIYCEGSGEIKVESEQNNSQLKIDLSTKSISSFGFGWMGVCRRNYDISLGQPDLATDLEVNLGSGKGELDLEKLKVGALDVDLGSGSMNLSPKNNSIPSGKFKVDVGSGSVKINIPEKVGLNLNYDVGSGLLKVAGSSFDGDGSYTSPDYKSAETKLELDIKLGSGVVTIETS